MANTGTLSIGIGANIDDLQRGIQDAERQLRTLERRRDDRVRIGADTSQIERQITSVQTHLNSLRTTANSTGGALGGMTQQVGNGSNALMQFSRIAQDAPFGIIGIGNNLTATAEAFGHLRNQTGSTGGALRAMASSLMGTGGILLGVSLLTTAFTVMSQEGISVGDVIDKLTGNFDEFGNAVKKASEEGAKSASKEIESLRSLVAVAQNDNIAKQDRLEAVYKLQSQFPAYYGNLSAEKIMYGDLTKETEAATKALMAKAVADKLADKAADKFIERMKAQKKFIDAKKKLDDFDANKLKKEQYTASLYAQMVRRRIISRNELIARAEEERQSLIKLVKEYDNFANIIDKLNETAAPLERTTPKAQKATKDNSGFELEKQRLERIKDNSGFELEKQRLERIIEINKEILKNENTLYYDRLAAQKAFSKAQLSLIDLTKNNELKDLKNTEADKKRIIEDANNKTVDAKRELAGRLKGITLFSNQDFSRGNLFDSFSTNIAPTIPPIALTFQDPTAGFMAWNEKVKVGLTTTEQNLLDFNLKVSEIINSGLVDAFAGIGNAIGGALGTGGNILEALGNSLLGALGGLLTQLGTMAIQVGVGLLGIKAALKSLNPAVAIAAGVALVALGSMFSSKSKKIGNSMGGSGGSTGGGGSSSNFSTSSGGFSSAGSGGGTVVFEIAGQKLIGVLSNTLDANRRLGGQTSLRL